MGDQTMMHRMWVLRTVTCMLFIVAMLAAATPPRAQAASETVGVWMTTADQSKLLQQQPGISFAPDSGFNPTTISVDETRTYQRIEGFGAALTDSSAWLISTTLTGAQRADLMTHLFDPANGIGLSMVREPIGATDFTVSGNYSFDDMPPGQTDPTLVHFSIAHDLAYIIPLLQQARRINPILKIVATPWSPPGWMKTTGSMNGGTLTTSAVGPWASYLVKYIQAYAAQGLPIYALTPQNEPDFLPPSYPGMTLAASDEANLIKNYLGPAVAAAGLSTRILAFDSSWGNAVYPTAIMDDPAALPYVAGTAFHCYNGAPDAQTPLHAAHPDKGIYLTECSRGDFVPTDFAPALAFDMHNLIVGATRDWASALIKWNIALDQNHGPQNYGCFNCGGVVTITHSAGMPSTVTYNEDYYALGHISKFVVPGAYRIGSITFGSGGIEDVAFRNPDGSKALIVFNGGTTSATFKVRWGSEAFSYTLPASAAATFTWSGTPQLDSFNAFNRIDAAFASSASGVTADACADVDGGQDMGPAANGSYLVYNGVDFGAGAGSVQARIATASSGGVIDLRLDSPAGPLIGTVPAPDTGGWQSWVTETVPISGALGQHTLYVVFTGAPSVASLHWLTFNRSAVATISAASYDGAYGVQTEPTSDIGAGLDVGYTANGDYLLFRNVDFGGGVSSVQARIASGWLGGTVELHLDSTIGPLIGSIAITYTGGWQVWRTQTAPISGAAGVHDLYVVFKGGWPLGNLNWLAFS